MSEVEIYCPKCKWKPPSAARWVCDKHMGGCGHRWNTFTTGGICPKCNYVWNITACYACKEYSLHVEWYHYPDSPKEQYFESEEIAESEVHNA